MFRKNDPLRARSYIHFDERPTRADLLKMVSDPIFVAKWQFLPLIQTTTKSKKIKSKKGAKFNIKIKERPICYASHKDAALYAYYAEVLNKKYGAILSSEGLSECITAFRPDSGKCNIHFAQEAFEWIGCHMPCVALAYDVKSFFDSLDHQILKKKWREVLGTDVLNADHFSVFRSLTKSFRIDRDDVYKIFNISIHKPKANGRNRICSAAEFREKVVQGGMLKKIENGIPQGTPISAVLSNIYMLDFDRIVSKKIENFGGLYRRYCDDILCIVPTESRIATKKMIESAIHDVKLMLQMDKVVERDFEVGATIADPLQYLGLTFDGERILLRSAGIARYYSRMRGGVRNADVARSSAARKQGVVKNALSIKRKKLNERYSYLGNRNFLTYASRAAKITGESGIKRQVSKHWHRLNSYVKSQDD